MRRWTIGLILILSLLTAPPAANAQQRGKVPRIGVLLPGSPTPEYERRLDAFRQGLRELGYIDTQNILLEYRWADAQYERMADLVAELLRLKVDLLVIDSTPAGLAAKRATSTLPIVLAVAGDPVGTGLVESLARPEGNITGMSLMHPELGAKRLGLLKDMVPTAARVAVLLNLEQTYGVGSIRYCFAPIPAIRCSSLFRQAETEAVRKAPTLTKTTNPIAPDSVSEVSALLPGNCQVIGGDRLLTRPRPIAVIGSLSGAIIAPKA